MGMKMGFRYTWDMSLGVHFAIDGKQLKALRKLVGDDEAVLEFAASLEEQWDQDWLAESEVAELPPGR